MNKKRRVHSVLLLLLLVITQIATIVPVMAAKGLDLSYPSEAIELRNNTTLVKSLNEIGWTEDLENNPQNKTMLFWAPLDWGSWSDYAVVYYDSLEKGFYIMRISGVPWSGRDGMKAPNGGDVKEAMSLVGAKDGVMHNEWLRAHPGSKNNSMKFKVGNSKYTLNFKTDYEPNYYKYESIIDLINEEASDYLNSGDKEKSLTALEGLLRVFGDTYDNSYSALTNKNNIDFVQKWFYTKSSNIASIDIKKEGTTVTLVASIEGKQSKRSMQDLKEVISSLNNSNVNLDNKPVLKILSETFNTGVLNKIEEQQQESADSEASKVSDITDGTFNEMSAYEKWSSVIINYVRTKGATSLDKLSTDLKTNYDLNNYNTWLSSHKDNEGDGKPDSLSDEEDLRLRAFFKVAASKSNSGVDVHIAFTYPTTATLRQINNVGVLNKDAVKQSADEAIKSVSDYGEAIASIRNIALNFDNIVRYQLAKVYGYTEGNPFEVDGEDDAAILQPSAYLNSLIPDIDETLGVIHYPVTLKRMDNAEYVASSTNAYDAYAQMQYILMLIATYAENDAYLTVVDEKATPLVYTNTKLDEFIAENVSNAVSAEMQSDIRDLVTAYLRIYKGLNYLGVKPFTPQLQAIYDYYNKLVSFEENTQLKAYDPAATGEPMRAFFSVEQQQLSYYYNLGVSLSATYIPMQTNLYDVNSLAALDDMSFVEQFHYPFGFNRKALYIDTNVNAAVDGYVSGKRDKQKIATLNDLLNPEKDIVLYLDDNFYNIHKLAELQGYTYNKLANTEDAGKDGSQTNSIGSFVTDLWGEWTDTNIENIAKTGAISSYSNNVKRKVSEYGAEKEKGNDYIFSSNSIDKYLTGYSADPDNNDVYNEYTPLQSFAVVSASYRQSALYNIIKKQSSKQPPVFVSSPNLAGITNIKQEQWNSIYNYIMLKNLKGNMGIDYKTTLDLDSPLYMDIYGNILTERGLVVIPAASNATLQKSTAYTIYSAGFMSLYDNGYALPSDYANSDKFMEGMFMKDEKTKTWVVKNKTIGNIYMNFRDLPVSDIKVLKSFKELTQQSINKGCLNFEERVWLITEVMRGAPIENIDKHFEGITGETKINKYGVFFAYKLDELSEQLLSNSNGNSMITLPNLAYMEGIEYVILFLFKLLFAVLLVLLFYKVYIDSVQGYLGIKTYTQFTTTLALFVIIAFSIPNLMDFSYYQVNKRLLQDEAEYISILNLEKKSDGREIGVYGVNAPETETTFYVKIDALSVPWYEVIGDVLFNNTYKTMNEVYNKAFETNLMSNLPGITKKSNGLYMDVNYLYDTSVVEYNSERNSIYHRVLETPYASYSMPYYVILDQLVARVNSYNNTNNIKSYTTKIQSRGAVKTVGIIESYFTSDYFMETSQDVLGFKSIYELSSTLIEFSPFTDTDINQMQSSLWYSEDRMDEKALDKKINKLDYEARNFVAKNRDLLGKVTDETFLKVMALSLSLKHNDIFGIPSAKSIEIFDIDSKDIIRLSIAPRRITMAESSKSFARFVYDNSGVPGVFASAMLIAVYFVSVLVKPLCTIIILACMISSLIIRKLIKRNNDAAIEGFLITMAILCGTNVVYALLFKLSMKLPVLGVSTTVAIIGQILLQCVYFIIISMFTVWVLRDWQNMGFDRYQIATQRLKIGAVDRANMTVNRLKLLNHPAADELAYADMRRSLDKKKKTKGLTGDKLYEAMRQRDKDREIEYDKR